MNCFETRNDFVALWQNAITPERRIQLLAHLRECPSCDHSFRVFTLTAPVLYSAIEPPPSSQATGPAAMYPGRTHHPGEAPAPANRLIARTISRAAAMFVMAAAAAVALYFAAPPHMTFEDAIGADNSNVELASYPSTDSFFGRELLAQDTSSQDLSDD
jgi:anti-sigma factor RsiW